MPTGRSRLLELAIESLENRKKQIDDEIAALRREVRSPGSRTAAVAAAPKKRRRRSHFSKEERERRSARMTSYWAKWRKLRPGKK